jgi:DNA-directed RNA polymerase subunit alpha
MKDVESARGMYYDEDGDSRGDRRNAALEVPITDFELSVRSRNCLKKMNIRTLGDLLRTTEQELLSYKNFGETSLDEIKALLTQKGLRLGQALEDPKLAAAVRRPAPSVAGNASPGSARQERGRSGIVRPQPQGAAAAQHQHSGDLAARTEDELLGCKNFGQTSLNEIKQQLTTFGLSLRKLEE